MFGLEPIASACALTVSDRSVSGGQRECSTLAPTRATDPLPKSLGWNLHIDAASAYDYRVTERHGDNGPKELAQPEQHLYRPPVGARHQSCVGIGQTCRVIALDAVDSHFRDDG